MPKGFERTWYERYPGVYTIVGKDPGTGKPERIYYLKYRRADGKTIEEKAGRASEGWTTKKASDALVMRRKGLEPTNEEKRQAADAEKKRMTVDKLAEYYFKHRPRQKSQISDKAKFNLHIKPELGTKIPEEIDPLSLDRFRASLGKKKSNRGGNLSPTTVRHTMALLRAIINFGVSRNLTEGTRKKVPVPPMPANMKTEDLTPAELDRLKTALDAEADQDAADIVRLVMLTGARRAEVMKIQWADVDTSRGVWILRDRKDGRTSGFPLPAPAVEILKKRDAMRGDSPSVFPGPGEDGHVVDPRAAFDRIRKAAKLPAGFRLLHGLRHHYASALVSSGVDLFVVSKLLGHATPDLTAKRYAHLRPGVMAEAAELAGRIIGTAAAEPAKEGTNE
jgi:integrase